MEGNGVEGFEKKKKRNQRFVKKIIPYNDFEIDLIEAWLEDLAAQGLILDHCFSFIAFFCEVEPNDFKYRIDTVSKLKRYNEEEQRAYYQERGWTYAGQHSPEFAIYYRRDEDDEELHTDSVVLERGLRTKIILRFGSSLVLFAVAAIFLFSKWGIRTLYETIGGDFAFYQISDYFLWGDLFVAIPFCFFYAFLMACASLVLLMRMIHRMKRGDFPMRERYSQKKAKVRAQMKLCLYLLAASVAVYCIAVYLYVIFFGM